MTMRVPTVLVLGLFLAGCAPATPQAPNPASVHCQEQGGRLEIRDAEGGQAGYCVFPDGSECEEWALYRGDCAAGESLAQLPNPASAFCEAQGGTLEIRDAEGGQAGYCLFADGSECEEWAFFRGECTPGGEAVRLANPASVYCEEQGGLLEIRDEESGQVGSCLFADGSECEEWAFLRGECSAGVSAGPTPSPQAAHCVDLGGRVELRSAESGDLEYCLFIDGSACEESALFLGKCLPRSRYQPLKEAECAALAAAVSEAWGVAVDTSLQPFRDYAGNEDGFGCHLQAVGTGLNFASFSVVAQDTRLLLAAQGWVEDAEFVADGPTATAAGFRQENRLCLLQASWEPLSSAACPEDQPVSACDLRPEQQLYSITLQCAQDVTPPESG